MSQLTEAGRSRHTWFVACCALIALAAFGLGWIGRASADKGGTAPTGISKAVSTVTNKADGVDATVSTCTTSLVFTDMPGMLVSFNLGGQASRSVVVLFQGEWAFDEGAFADIRLTIDGVVQSGPQDVVVADRPAGEPPSAGTHGFNFLSDLRAPGLHVARIQWRSGGTFACVTDRSLIVLHK